MIDEPLALWEGVGKEYPAAGGGLAAAGGDGPAWAVRGVDLRVMPGEVVGLLGPNRAGKTTLAKLLLSLCRPTEGRVLRFGRPSSYVKTLARVGYVHEDPAFPTDLTATALLRYYGALGLTPAATLRRRIPELLERVGLSDRAREPIGRFSKGMVRRLGLAQALLNDPDLLVMDEPAEGLDLDGRALLRAVVLGRKAAGKSVLLISHATDEVGRLCDRAAVLVAGRKVHDGPLPSPATRGGTLDEALGSLYRGEGVAA